MRNIHLLLIYVCTLLVCASCNENEEFISDKSGEKYSRSQEIQNLLGETENLSLYISPELENVPLTKGDTERMKRLASKAKEASPDMNQVTQVPLTRQTTSYPSLGYEEKLIHIDNLDMIVALEWMADFSGSNYNATPTSINFADIHIDLKNAPSGYWFKVALKRWEYEDPTLTYRGEAELCKYIDNQEYMELIGFTFSIEPRYNGYGNNFRYTLDRSL